MKNHIDLETARAELGEEQYQKLYSWLRDHGHLNFEQVGESNWKRSEIFITRDQMSEFIGEQLKDWRGTDNTTDELWGQTRETLSKKK